MKLLIAASTLINQLTVPFVPEDYTDEYRTALLDLIETKIEKEDVQAKSIVNPKKGSIISIMEALNTSIEQTKLAKSTKIKSTSKKKGNELRAELSPKMEVAFAIYGSHHIAIKLRNLVFPNTEKMN